MIDPAQFADHYQPNFGRMYEAPFTRERLESLPRHALEMYEKLCHEEEVNAKLNPITNGIIFPMWRKVQENYKKYQYHILLGGNRSGKSTFMSRFATWAACTIPGAECHVYQANSEKSINEQQRYVRESFPASFAAIPTKKGVNHSLTWSQKNGFTDDVCIFPPHSGARRGGYIKFRNYAQFSDDPNTAESFKAHFIWCIAEGELVQMSNGLVMPIEDISAGDVVLSIDLNGHPVARKVLAVQCQGKKECIRLRPRNGTPITCTPDHDIYWGYKSQSKKPASKTSNIAQIRPGWWPKKTTDRDDAWYVWAALVVAEGSVSMRKVTSGAVAEMEKAIAILPAHARVRRQIFKCDHVPDWFLMWPEFWEEFPIQLSAEKEIPMWVFISSKDKAILFLRWLYQGDGWVSNHTVGYGTTSYRLAWQIVILLNRLGVRASFCFRKPARANWREQFWVHVSKAEDVIKFIEMIGVEGKKSATDAAMADALRRIASNVKRGVAWRKNPDKLEPDYLKWKERSRGDRLKSSTVATSHGVGLKTVYDLTIEGEHRFLCGTSLVSNCDEECPADLFSTLPYRCVDYRGKIFLSFTTIQGWSPLVQQLLGRTKTIEKRIAPLLGIELPTMQEAMFTDPKRLTGAKCCIYYFWTEDNCFIDVPSFRASMQGKPKDEIKARAYGVPVKSVTGVFDGFGEINIVPHEKLPWLVKPDYKVTHYQGIDPGGSKHWFMVWMAVDAADTWWIWAEWPDASYGEWALPGSGLEGKAGLAQKGTNKGIRDYIEIMRSIEDGMEVYERLIDPRAGAAQKQGEEGAVTIISDLDDAGLLPPVRPAPLTRSSSGGEIEVGLQLITNRLAYDANKKIDSINAPKIYVSDRCVNVIYAMQNYTAKGGQGEACKDPVDCVRLMAVAGPEHIQFVADTGRTGVY